MNLKFIEHPNLAPAMKKGLAASVNDIAENMNQFCKWLSGDTYRSMRWDQTGEYMYSISWNTPYVVYAYYRGAPQYTMNPQATLRWAHYAASLYEKFWGNYIGYNISTQLGRLI